MKVYVIEKNNTESYEDYHTWIGNVHGTFRNASQELIDSGFTPFYETIFGVNEVRFIREVDKEYDEFEGARILERDFYK